MRFTSARRELIWALISREMKARYKGSSLGVLWSLLTPLFMAGIYAFFFRLIAGRAANTSSILVGVFAWQYTANAIQQGLGSISNNGNLIKKVSFPRIILPLSVVSAAGIDYLISLGIQLLVVGILLLQEGTFLTFRLIYLPLIFLMHSWFNLGIAMLLGSMNVYYRDTQHFVSVAISALFFLSPAMYDLTFVQNLAGDLHPLYLKLYQLNPLSGLFTAYRWAFLPDMAFPASAWLWVGLLWPVPFTLLAIFIFKRAQRNFADYV